MTGAVLGLAAALGLALLVLVGSSPPERGLNQLVLPLVYAVPGLLALLSLRGRPVLLVPATALSLLLSVTTLSGVSLILLAPAACFGLALRHRRGWRPSLPRPVLAGALPLLAVLGAFAIVVVGIGPSDPRCWTYEEFADGRQTYADVACNETGGVGPIMASGPATTIVTTGPSGSEDIARPGPGSSGSPGDGTSGSEVVPPPGPGSSGTGAVGSGVLPPLGPGMVSSGGGSTSDSTTALEAAAGAALIAAGLTAGSILSSPGGQTGASKTPFATRAA